jgi:hypothetical protein
VTVWGRRLAVGEFGRPLHQVRKKVTPMLAVIKFFRK